MRKKDEDWDRMMIGADRDGLRPPHVHFLFTNTFERYRDTNGVDEFVGRITELYKDFDYNQKCTKEEFSESEQARLFNNYPINVVRNMARFYSNSKYILSADMNHLFSRNFERKMINLANKVYTKGNNFALTYRIFEVNQNQTEMPNTKVLLKELMKKGPAFEFHHYMAAHKIKNLSEWLNTPESHLNTDPQFNVTLTNAQWEPQFVSLRNVPFHDESFFYPVRDNTAQRWEMCHLNYQFVIANDVFMFHHGIKERQEKNTIEMARLNIFPWAFPASFTTFDIMKW
uniref:Beta-1,4-glucuronyltransferase 1 n=1 Tax=Rhabditophanes sp. KR3021 TaxID=114890 RepID=A0AC35U8Q7_9BILA